MSKVREYKLNDRKDKQTVLLVIAAFVIVVSAGVFWFLRFYNSYIDGMLYQERLSQMKEVTTQLFTGLEDVVQNQWKEVDTFTNYVELGKPEDAESLLTFMGKQVRLNNMETAGENLVAVDELGRYLTQDGWQGTLEEMELLLDKPERVSFVSKSLTSDETYMYFLNRLPEPVQMQDGDRTTNLIYYGVAKDMTQLNGYFTCEAYNDSNSVYVLDKQGTRLFRSNNNDLIEGYNAYSVLEKMEYLHGHSFEDARAELDKSGYGYANAVLNGEEYYYALYQMDYAEWTLLFLVPSSYVATNVVSMVNTTVRLIMVFAVVLLIVSASVIFMIQQIQQKRALKAERRNNETLAGINKELDHKNNDLIEAVRIAETATQQAESATEQAEQAMQEAQRANRAKSDFLANMSHDIRTPMNAIVGITKLMAHDKSDPEKMDTYIRKVQQSSQHLLSLINDVLDMSKIESGSVTLNTEPVSMAEQVAQVESIIRSQTEERDQDFEIRIREIHHEYLIGDAVRLRQILINLLSNAVKYTPVGGRIVLELEEQACDIPGHAAFHISVTDNGYGMTPEFVTHIFEPFTRAENSTTNKVQGTGLGMAITRNIVEMMGGRISVQSEPEKGSCFVVDLPLPIDYDIRNELPVKNILLITDEDSFIRNVSAAFRDTDASLYVAQTEAEADSKLEKENIELVLLDRQLQGQTLADHIKRLRTKTKDAILIYCCNYTEQNQVRIMAGRGEIDGIIVRPFFLSNLIRAVDRIKNNTPIETHDGKSILNGMKFLCAEDNALNAEILTALLDMNGATCTIYPDGQQIANAFATVKPGEYDAILMDVQMPVMNGLDATRVIRRSTNPLGRTIPIIAMTANAFSEDVQSCLDAGMDAHVSKPLDVSVLERTVQNIVKFSGGGTTVRP